MNIRFVSTLTPDDEDAIASVLMTSARAILDQFPIVYTLRIETAARVFQHASEAIPVTLANAPKPIGMPLNKS